jgi:hypothetical protein
MITVALIKIFASFAPTGPIGSSTPPEQDPSAILARASEKRLHARAQTLLDECKRPMREPPYRERNKQFKGEDVPMELIKEDH